MASQKQKKEARKHKKQAERTRIRQPGNELFEQLKRQVRLLCKSSKEYDLGDIDEALQVATRIRVLVHETPGSHSLLGQLGKSACMFYDSATPRHPKADGPYHGLAAVELSTNSRFWIPLLSANEIPIENTKPFNDWWEVVVLDDQDEIHFTRKEIVLAVCNQDGGAHVDPELDERYYRLEKSRDFAYTFCENSEKVLPRAGAGFASVRQIGLEVMLALNDEFPSLLKGKYFCPIRPGIKKTDTAIIGGFQLIPIDDPRQ